MAKTNPYNSRQTGVLGFDEAQAGDDLRPAPAGQPRQRAAARSGDLSAGVPLRRDFRDDESSPADSMRVGRRAPVQPRRWANFRWFSFFFKTRIGLSMLALALLAAAVVLVLGYRGVRDFLEQDAHFRIDSSSSIQIHGAADADAGGLNRADLLGIFGGDIGRNIFFVPLHKRQAQLEQLPWVAHATVMRLLPDRLSVSVAERTPVAFVRFGAKIGLVDAEGVLLSLPPAALALRHYSFPVVTGLSAGDAPEARRMRMQLYQRFVAELDSAGQNLSSELSEVDLTDTEDIRALVPAQGTDLLLHFGDSDFLPRYRSYQAHLAEWRQQYPHLSAIDLRYDRQVVLKMADGAESEAGDADLGTGGNSLTAAPQTAAHKPAAHPLAHPAHHPASHGTAHGWRPE